MINKERLLKLAALLRKNAANPKGVKFDLDAWAMYDDRKSQVLSKGPIPLNCNTTACAVGLAAISGLFKEEGLGYVAGAGTIIPTYGRESAWEAVNSFFGLTENQAGYLFADVYYPHDHRRSARGEIAVANRIATFVASDGSVEDKIDYEDYDRGNGYAD